MLLSNERTIQTPDLTNFAAFEVQESSVINWFEFANSLKETTLQLKRAETVTYGEQG